MCTYDFNPDRIMSDNLPNFGQFVKIWRYYTFEVLDTHFNLFLFHFLRSYQ